MRYFNFFLIAFILAAFSSARAEQVTLTADETVVLALRNNRDVLLKAEDVEDAKKQIAAAKAELFPTLNFTGSRTYTRGLYAKDLGQATTQATLKQYLYKGGKVQNTIKQNEYEFIVAGALFDKQKQETAYSAQEAFYALLLSGEAVSLNKSILDNTRQHFDFLKARFHNGEASETDLLEIKAAVDNTNQAFEAAVNQQNQAQEFLKNLLYLDEEITLKPTGGFELEPQEIAYDDAFLKALKSRPEIRQYEAQARADKHAAEAAKADARPNIYASWDYYSRSTSSLTFSPTKAWQDYNVIGLTFSWPLFDGWATAAKVEQALIDLKQTQLSGEKAIKDIILELKSTYLELKTALSGLEAYDSQLIFYQKNLKNAQEKYANGLASILDLEDARLKFQVAGFNKHKAAYEYIIAQAKFYKAMGERV